MEGKSRPKVVLPSSRANTTDADTLSRLLSQVPKLRQIDCIHQFSEGYSGCRVYLVQATFAAEAPRPWILKLGSEEEIRAEAAGLALAEAFVSPDNLASKIADLYDGSDGVLAQQFGNYYGRRALDLDGALQTVYSLEAFKGVVRTIEGWLTNTTWKKASIGTQLKAWTGGKLSRLPTSIQATATAPVLYSPDFGEAFANPIYCLSRDVKRLELSCPYSFSHGDLNLRNVLFARETDAGLNTTKPVLIDFRHASDEQWAIVDLAKLEACLRYTWLRPRDDYDFLQQIASFLAATRNEIALSPLPEHCTNKILQDVWRCLEVVRDAVKRVLSGHPGSETVYWVTLASYGISSATYAQLTPPEQHLAYLDAAALLTQRVLERSTAGEQHTLPIHATLSPPVRTAGALAPTSPSRISALRTSIAKGRCVLVVGPGYARGGGVDPFSAFAQRLYNDLLGEAAPVASARVVLEALAKKRSRTQIQRALIERAKRWNQETDTSFAQKNWAGVINYHFHDLPLQALQAAGRAALRIDSADTAIAETDNISAGHTFYLPLHGDIWSPPDALVLSHANWRQRQTVLHTITRALAGRQVPLSLIFWRAEDLSIEDIAFMRDLLTEDLQVSVETFFLSEQHNNARDMSLSALDITRLDYSLAALIEQVAEVPLPATRPAGHTWVTAGGDKRHLPDLSSLTHRLLSYFDGNITVGITTREGDSDFLLGAPPTSDDIDAGRVVFRTVARNTLIPAIKGAIAEADKAPYAITLTGRAGAGITTLLCMCAHEFAREGQHPVLVADTLTARGRKEWLEAGAIVAEVSRIADATAVLFVDAHEKSFEDMALLVEGVQQSGGRVVPVLGGRRETLSPALKQLNKRLFTRHYTIDDGLAESEWSALARILRRHGFSSTTTEEALTRRLQQVGHLLPAIYEATDRQNRKFREIVAYEYEGYGSDALVQRAYRLICTLGAFGVSLTQYWLLKALGGRAMDDARRILGALSEDIVVRRERLEEDGDVQIAPRHRIIAEQVVAIATPDARERIADLESLISTANLASADQGMAVAKLLYNKGALTFWVRHAFPSEQEQEEKMAQLIEAALENKPHHPQVELNLRQHYALQLRSWGQYDEALVQAEHAAALDKDNPATDHIVGLIHDSRAIRAWKAYSVSQKAETLARAKSDERDALDFFQAVRDRRPFQEHGYESEARYYRKKRDALVEKAIPVQIEQESRFQVYQGLSLLTAAQQRVPREALKESPKTRAYLERLAGDLSGALKTLATERDRCDDPVRKRRLTRVAATLAAEANLFADAEKYYSWLIKEGERDPALYLARDDALAELGKGARDRAIALQDSAEEYNRWDVETLVRWAALLVQQRKLHQAGQALARADEVSQGHYSIFERERQRGALEENGALIRFAGRVERFFRGSEGYVSSKELEKPIYFRAQPQVAAQLSIGTEVTFGLAWRVRGFRAIDVLPAK